MFNQIVDYFKPQYKGGREDKEYENLTLSGRIEYTEKQMKDLETLMIFENTDYGYRTLLNEYRDIKKDYQENMLKLRNDMQNYPEMFI